MHNGSKHVEKTEISTPQVVFRKKHIIQHRFFKYKYVAVHSKISQISAVESMASQLRDMDVSIDDTAVITKISITLPSSYRHFMSA